MIKRRLCRLIKFYLKIAIVALRLPLSHRINLDLWWIMYTLVLKPFCDKVKEILVLIFLEKMKKIYILKTYLYYTSRFQRLFYSWVSLQFRATSLRNLFCNEEIKHIILCIFFSMSYQLF
jgi:hypothetical protein